MVVLIEVDDASGDTSEPDLVMGYETSRTSRNIRHEIVGGGIGVSLIPADLRRGTLRLYYGDREADAAACVEMHARGEVMTITIDERDTLSMSYFVDGEFGYSLDEQTRDDWVVSVAYQEIDT